MGCSSSTPVAKAPQPAAGAAAVPPAAPIQTANDEPQEIRRMFSRGAMGGEATPMAPTPVTQAAAPAPVSLDVPPPPVAAVATPVAATKAAAPAAAVVAVVAAATSEAPEEKAGEAPYWDRPKSTRELAPVDSVAPEEGAAATKATSEAAAAAEVVEEEPSFVTTREEEEEKPAEDDEATIDEEEEDVGEEEGGEPDTSMGNEETEEQAVKSEAAAAAGEEAAAEEEEDDGYPPVRPVLHTEKPCDSFELDMEHTEFNMCKCGHKKTKHSIEAQDGGGKDKDWIGKGTGSLRKISSPPSSAPPPAPPVWVQGAKPSLVQKRESSSKKVLGEPHPSDADLL